MNIFDTIYFGNDDPIDCAFIAAETALNIEIERATNDYMYESGLISLNDNSIFIESQDATESSTGKKHENIFIKALKAICNAIRNFIGDIVSVIAGLFDGRENIKPEEYFESPTAKVRLDRDVKQLEYIVDDEIRKGNKLLQKVSSKTGVSDEEIDSWVRTGATKLEKLAPILIPVATAFGFKMYFNHKEKKKLIEHAEKLAADGDTQDPKKNKQKMKIVKRMHELVEQSSLSVKNWANAIQKAKRKKRVDKKVSKLDKWDSDDSINYDT